MKIHFKYSILTALALLATIGLVFAQPPIGTTRQPNPFESNPSNNTATNMGTVTTPGAMYDGGLLSSASFPLGSGFFGPGTLVIDGFDTPLNAFPIGWVDLKMKYHVPVALNDDTYRIEYSTDGVNWIVLQPDTGNAFDFGGNPPPVVPWSQIAPSHGGAWTWADLASLEVRVYATKVGTWDAKSMYLYEVWATVYPFPPPPTSSATMSIQPSTVTVGPPGAFVASSFFVDVYVMEVTSAQGYEIVVTYDTGVLTASSTFTYYPFKSEAIPPTIDDAAGYVSLAYYTFGGDSVGFTGNMSIARIYFDVENAPTADESMLHFDVHKIGDVLGTPIVHTSYDGLFRIAHYMSAEVASPGMIDLANPIGTVWHEIYPYYSEMYDLTSWNDNGDGVLSASDQIDMYSQSAGTTDWYHVDQVTTTIHFTFKDDPLGLGFVEGVAEPEMPEHEESLPDPIGSRWHMIYPPEAYSLTFTITSWTDNGDGVFDASDQFDFEYDLAPGVPTWAHLDAVSTDIIVTPKPGPVPEFPLGLGAIMLLAPAIPIIYLWRTRKWVRSK